MKKRIGYVLLLSLFFLFAACGTTVKDPLELVGKTFSVENLRTNKDYATVTFTAEEEKIYATGLAENGETLASEVVEVAEEPDETSYYLVEWGEKTYYAGRIEDDVYFWFTHNPDEIGSTAKNEYVLKLIEED